MLTEDLLQLALARAQGEESKQAHVVASSIFGAIAPFLDGKLILQTYLHKAMGLCQVDADFSSCLLRLYLYIIILHHFQQALLRNSYETWSQDTDSEVRTCMCEQLNNISRSVGLNTFMVTPQSSNFSYIIGVAP